MVWDSLRTTGDQVKRVVHILQAEGGRNLLIYLTRFGRLIWITLRIYNPFVIKFLHESTWEQQEGNEVRTEVNETK